jgi:tetratricopeptide (TPR) repeat protein
LELGKKAGVTPDQVPVWLRMTRLSSDLSDTARTKKLDTETQRLARELVKKSPEDALAHAWLAAALGWNDDHRREAETEARRALELDPKCWRAKEFLVEGMIGHSLHELLPGGAPALGAPHLPEDRLNRQLYDHSPDNERLEAMEKTIHEAEKLMDDAIADAGTDITAKLDAAANRLTAFLLREKAKLFLGHRPSSFDSLPMMMNQLQVISGTGKVLEMMQAEWEALIPVFSRVSPPDPQLLGSSLFFKIMLFGVQGKTWDKLPPELRAKTQETLKQIAGLEHDKDPVIAAKAREMDAFLQLSLGEMNWPGPFHVGELAGQAVALDPRRMIAWDCLSGSLGGARLHSAACAAAEIRLALLPTIGSHRQCAAGAQKAGDYKESLRHLEAVLQKKPDDLETLVAMAAVKMRAAGEKDDLKELGKFFDHIKDLYSAQRENLNGGVIEDLLINYAVFLALNGDDSQAVAVVQSGLSDGRLSEKPGTKLLKILRPVQ